MPSLAFKEIITMPLWNSIVSRHEGKILTRSRMSGTSRAEYRNEFGEAKKVQEFEPEPVELADVWPTNVRHVLDLVHHEPVRVECV